MDARGTLKVNETFAEILRTCFATGEKVSMIIDDAGLSRIEDTIKELQLESASPHVELQNGSKIDLKNIVAVNGIFSPAYSEC